VSAFIEVFSTTNGGSDSMESRRGLDLVEHLENFVMTGAYLSSSVERVAL